MAVAAVLYTPEEALERAKRWSTNFGGIQGVGMETVQYVAMLLNDPCSYCGRFARQREVDHITARSKGGANTWENLTAACRRCNLAKRSKTLLQAVAESAYRPFRTAAFLRELERVQLAVSLYPNLKRAFDQAVDDRYAAQRALDEALAREAEARENWARAIEAVPA